MRTNDDDTRKYIQYYKQIESGELNETNVSVEFITEIHNLACKLNGGTAPNAIAILYANIMNGDE